jgi:hypothetical protein
VIDQYKELEKEHKTTKAQVEELQAALAKYSPFPSLETRQRSQESEEDKRDTSGGDGRREKTHVNFQGDESMGGKSNEMFFKTILKKTTRKGWFRDLQLGTTKRPSQENVRYR